MSPQTPSVQPSTPPAGLALKRRKKYRLRRQAYSIVTSEPDAQPVGGGVSEEIVEQLQTRLRKAEEDMRVAGEKSLRALADLENQRRRHQKEKDDIRRLAAEDLVSELLQPMDHFVLALQSLDSATEISAVRQGIGMIHREFASVLGRAGLEEINPVDESFDPLRHEAVATASDASKAEGTVLEVMRLGWAMRGKVLRPAMVKVNKPEA